jgi:hypothetical protein
LGTFPKEAFKSVLSTQPQTSKYNSIEVTGIVKKYAQIIILQKKKIKCHNVVVRVGGGKF